MNKENTNGQNQNMHDKRAHAGACERGRAEMKLAYIPDFGADLILMIERAEGALGGRHQTRHRAGHSVRDLVLVIKRFQSLRHAILVVGL